MLELVPITLKEANAFVERYHRHHKPVVGHKFSIAASDGEKIVGVAIVGRPVSRYLDNGLTLEVNRLCTDGTRNACSFLHSAAWRAARNLGYKKLITYILVSETGSSLKAAGWKCVGECGGKRWNGRSAPKVDLYPAQMKLRFEVEKGGEVGIKAIQQLAGMMDSLKQCQTPQEVYDRYLQITGYCKCCVDCNFIDAKGADELMCLAAYLAGNEQARAEAQQKAGKKA